MSGFLERTNLKQATMLLSLNHLITSHCLQLQLGWYGAWHPTNVPINRHALLVIGLIVKAALSPTRLIIGKLNVMLSVL